MHACRQQGPSQASVRHLVHASHVTAGLDSETSQQAGMLASTLSAAPEFAASQAFSNIMPFGRCRALVLDSSYRPIDVVNWQRAICLDLFDKVSHPQEVLQTKSVLSLQLQLHSSDWSVAHHWQGSASGLYCHMAALPIICE